MSAAANVLCEEILAEAGREAERIVAQARAQADSLHQQGEREAAEIRQQILVQAQKEAAQKREWRLAGIPLETNRRRAARVEELLDSLREAVRKRLLGREGYDYRETLVNLAAKAIMHMDTDQFIIRLSPADCAGLGDSMLADIKRRVGRTAACNLTVMEDPTIEGGGLLVQDPAGRQVWDNRLPARLDRLWPELRRQVAVQAGLVERAETGGGAACAP